MPQRGTHAARLTVVQGVGMSQYPRTKVSDEAGRDANRCNPGSKAVFFKHALMFAADHTGPVGICRDLARISSRQIRRKPVWGAPPGYERQQCAFF